MGTSVDFAVCSVESFVIWLWVLAYVFFLVKSGFKCVFVCSSKLRAQACKLCPFSVGSLEFGTVCHIAPILD